MVTRECQPPGSMKCIQHSSVGIEGARPWLPVKTLDWDMSMYHVCIILRDERVVIVCSQFTIKYLEWQSGQWPGGAFSEDGVEGVASMTCT